MPWKGIQAAHVFCLLLAWPAFLFAGWKPECYEIVVPSVARVTENLSSRKEWWLLRHHRLVMDESDASDCEYDCLCDTPVDGLQEDDPLRLSEVLTEDEVILRRAKRTRYLMKLYRTQWWGLMEEMRTKHRRFYLKHGKSGWRDESPEARQLERAAEDRGFRMREPEKGSAEILHCGAQGCTAKPLALSVFCFGHVLLDPRQRLYKPCSYLIQRGQNDATPCGSPVLQSIVPPMCGQHYHLPQKQTNRSVKKALPGGTKSNPQLHLIISEYVRVIQNKRRKLGKKASVAGTLENNGGETSQLRAQTATQSKVSAVSADGRVHKEMSDPDGEPEGNSGCFANQAS